MSRLADPADGQMGMDLVEQQDQIVYLLKVLFQFHKHLLGLVTLQYCCAEIQ